MKFDSLALVVIQYVTMGYLLLTTDTSSIRKEFVLLKLIGLILGLWAIWTMRNSNMQVVPEPARNAKLVTNGPYRYIRHPMYVGLILISLALLFTSITENRVFAFFVLVINLLLKIHLEEAALLRKFPSYKTYSRKTSRLIPFIF